MALALARGYAMARHRLALVYFCFFGIIEPIPASR